LLAEEADRANFTMRKLRSGSESRIRVLLMAGVLPRCDTGQLQAMTWLAPITRSLPFGSRPLISSDIAFEFGAVAMMTRAPLIFRSSSAAFVALLSIYTSAPSLRANASFSGPRPTAATL